MKTKLILIDGIPGCGKSTTSQWVSEQLNLNGFPANWHYEISSANPLKIGLKICDVSDDNLLDYGIKTWTQCIEHLTNSNHVTVLDAGLFQHIILEAFYRNLSVGEIAGYLQKIEDILFETKPVLIYFSPNNVPKHIAQTYSHRGTKCTNLLVEWTTSSPFAQAQSLEGYAGSLQFWDKYHSLCSKLFDDCALEKLKLARPETPVWLHLQDQISNFLQLSRYKPETLIDDRVYVGTYHCKNSNKRFQITKQGDHLYATGLLEPLEQQSVLIVAQKDKIIVRGHDVVLKFKHISETKPTVVSVESSWPQIDGATFIFY